MANAREQIVETARQVFATRGYADVSVRDIAEAAGVSPSLVIKHCGSKAELFRAAARVQADPSALEGPLEGLGERLVLRTVAAQREGRPSPVSRTLVLVLGAPEPDELRAQVREAYLDALEARLVGAGVEPREAGRRAQLAMAQLVGLSASLRMLHSFDADDEELVARAGAQLQAALDGR